MTEHPSIKPVLYVVDDYENMRELIAQIGNLLGAETHEYESAVDFLNDVTPMTMGCLVCDYAMSPMNGLELQKRLQEMGVQIPAIIISGSANISVAVQAMENGAFTFLEKPFERSEILARIKEGLERSRQIAIANQVKSSARATLEQLSESETATLHLLVNGESSKQIASQLEISLRTVQRYKNRICDVTQLDTAVQWGQLLLEAEIPIRSNWSQVRS